MSVQTPVHLQKCLHVSIRPGPWSNGSRWPGPMNHICVYIVNLRKRWHHGWQTQCNIGFQHFTACLNTVADQLEPFTATVFPDGSGLFQHNKAPCNAEEEEEKKRFRNGLRNIVKTVQGVLDQLWDELK